MNICIEEGIPTLEEAKIILEEASSFFPGPWKEHSINVGKAAELIANGCKDLNPQTALVLGMLHDIGYRFGNTNMKHILYGYNFMMEKGYCKSARICLTHSFNCHDLKGTFGKWDNFTQNEYDFVDKYIGNIEYDDYDKLIQLCDALALPSGYCLMEKRMIDVALRHGIHEHIVNKWKATFEAKAYFENKIGTSIYSVLPGVVENTFEF